MVTLKKILVTGGNTGIGYALCHQLAVEKNCHVYLTARTPQKGLDAVTSINAAISSTPSCQGRCDYIPLDTADDASVLAAVEETKSKLEEGGGGGGYLYGVVNNAGTGFSHGSSPDVVVNTNLYGPKRVSEAFLPLLDPDNGRIVNVGSGAASMYMSQCSKKDIKALCDPNTVTWDTIERHLTKGLGSSADSMGGYGLSKALLASYTAVFAREHPNVTVSCISPGFIDTNMTKGFGASKGPAEGTLSIKHCLFEKLKGNGWYYGSDAVRSPLHEYRDPGEPEYDGSLP